MRKKYLNNKKNDDNKHDRYLITYADLITLLLGLFVILYASSQVDEAKYKEMSAAFSNVFGDIPADKREEIVKLGKKVNPIDMPSTPKTKSLEEVQKKAEIALDMFIQQKMLTVQRDGHNLVINMPESLLFLSGKADISSESGELLDSLASLLSNIDMNINIDGHTDTTPIRTFRYESNWHLSTARALNMGYALAERNVPEQYMVIRGFGSQRPIAGNNTEEGKSKNRRVEIRLSELDKETPVKTGYSENKY